MGRISGEPNLFFVETAILNSYAHSVDLHHSSLINGINTLHLAAFLHINIIALAVEGDK